MGKLRKKLKFGIGKTKLITGRSRGKYLHHIQGEEIPSGVNPRHFDTLANQLELLKENPELKSVMNTIKVIYLFGIPIKYNTRVDFGYKKKEDVLF